MRKRARVGLAFVLLACACSAPDDSEHPGTSTSTWPGAGLTPGGTVGGGGGGGGGRAGGAAGQGGEAPCPADMVVVEEICIDRFEAPNEQGTPPLAMQTAYDGEDWCAGRGKRLCTDVEWIRACDGGMGQTYPYGNAYVAHRCNDDSTWISPDWAVLATWPSVAAVAEAAALYQGDPSGARGDCVSAEGAFDLTGNVAEWVVRTIPNANNYDHVMKGCYWSGCYGGTLPNCSFVNPAHPGAFRSYEAGFRCCRDALIVLP